LNRDATRRDRMRRYWRSEGLIPLHNEGPESLPRLGKSEGLGNILGTHFWECPKIDLQRHQRHFLDNPTHYSGSCGRKAVGVRLPPLAEQVTFRQVTFSAKAAVIRGAVEQAIRDALAVHA